MDYKKDWIDHVKKIVEILNILQKYESFYLTLSKFNELTDKQKNILTNTENPSTDWTKFKESFTKFQYEIGFRWIPYQAYAGPLRLEDFIIPGACGLIWAEELLQKKDQIEGNLEQYFYKLLPGLTEISLKIDLSEARRTFSEKELNNQTFTFRTNSNNYFRVIKSYTYQGS